MYETSDFRNGIKVEIEGQPWELTFFQHVKPGKGNAFTRTKFKNLIDGRTLEITMKSGEVLKKADVETKPFQYLYKEDENFVFMDKADYEQTLVPEKLLGESVKFMQENMDVDVVLFKGKPVGVELPYFVDLTVVSTGMGTKGDTASGGATKPAELETGFTIQVPLFIKEGEKVRIDTRTGKFSERAKG